MVGVRYTVGYTKREPRARGSGFYRYPNASEPRTRRIVMSVKKINSAGVNALKKRLYPKGQLVLDALIREIESNPKADAKTLAEAVSIKVSAPKSSITRNNHNYFSKAMVLTVFELARASGVIKTTRVAEKTV